MYSDFSHDHDDCSKLANLECGTGSVIHVGLDLDGFLEHDAEGGVGTIALEAAVILATNLACVCVNNLYKYHINIS